MKYALVVMVGIVCLALMAGCIMPNKAFVLGVDGHTQVILPEYKAYVAQDATLDETSKRIRMESADSLQRLVDAAKEAPGL